MLQNGQSEYVRQFSGTVEYLEGVVATDDQIIKAPAPKYPLASEQTNVVCSFVSFLDNELNSCSHKAMEQGYMEIVGYLIMIRFTTR